MLCSEIQLEGSWGDATLIKPLPCRRWSCSYCRPMLRARMIRRALAGRPDKMLTLTCRTTTGDTPEDAHRLLHRAWRVLAKRIARYHKLDRIEYAAFVEPTKRGWPHLHILLRCPYTPFDWISAQMAELLDSPHVYIEAIKHQSRAAQYVSKYVTKEQSAGAWARRVWYTRKWSLEQTPEHDTPAFRPDDVFPHRSRWAERIEHLHRIGAAWYQTEDYWFLVYAPGAWPVAGSLGSIKPPWYSEAAGAWSAARPR